MLFAKIFPKVVTRLFSALFSLGGFGSPINKKPPVVPDSFKPILRFALCSDIHLNGEENQQEALYFSDIFPFCNEYTASHKSYKGLDALMICGDMTDEGREKQYKVFENIVRQGLPEKTRLLACMGNHEFIESSLIEGVDPFENYKKYVSKDIDTHIVLKGYHFIGLSYCNNKESFGQKVKWLDKELKAACREAPTRPVFVFHHPHVALSVYGSIHWGDLSLRSVIRKYHQVVDFSGHSHYCPVDPRALWQGSFTAVGTGAVTGLVGNNNYLDGNAVCLRPSSSWYIVEADENGNILLRPVDGKNKCFYGSDRYLTATDKKQSHYYSWKNSLSLDTPPSFSKDAEIRAEKKPQGYIITFPDAKGYYPAASYNITLKNDKGKRVFYKSVVSSYLTACESLTTVNVGELGKGHFKAEITPLSPYYKAGLPLKGDIYTE